jgi:hypothetical protein
MGKFRILINDQEEPLWESQAETLNVDRIEITNARGEVTTIGSPATDDWLRIRVNERAEVETYLDQNEAVVQEQRREKYELGQGEGEYVAMDEETGEPQEETEQDLPEPGEQLEEEAENNEEKAPEEQLADF